MGPGAGRSMLATVADEAPEHLSGSDSLTMLPTDGVVPGGVGMTAAAGLGRGERAPDMVLASSDGTPTRYYAQAGGRPALLVFADEGCVARLDALAEGLGAIGDEALTVHVVGPPALAGHDLRFPLLQDPDGRAAGAYRTGGAPTAFLLDPNLRVRAALPFADGARVAADVAELVAELVWDDRQPPEITTQAPLLVVPDVLGPEQCADLIAVWEQQGHSETGAEAGRGAAASGNPAPTTSGGPGGAAVSGLPGSVVGSCPSCPRRSRTGRAASRA